MNTEPKVFFEVVLGEFWIRHFNSIIKARQLSIPCSCFTIVEVTFHYDVVHKKGQKIACTSDTIGVAFSHN